MNVLLRTDLCIMIMVCSSECCASTIVLIMFHDWTQYTLYTD